MLPMIISIQIPHMLHLERKLFESLGFLVLVRRDCIDSRKFIIYKIRKGCSMWSSKYIVNIDDFMNPLLEGWSIRSIVWSIVLGEGEEDYFLIINLSAKVVQYNLISKTLCEIYDMGSNDTADDYRYGFIPPYTMYDVGYKKLDYKASTTNNILTHLLQKLKVDCMLVIMSRKPNINAQEIQICSLDSPAGLFVNHIRSSFDCDFVSLDPKINLRKYIIKNSFTLGFTEEANKVKILQSCNGLLLCTGSRRHAFDYVYNTSTNLLKIFSEPDYANVESNVYGCARLRLEFDPTKSPYYKVVHAGRTWSDICIQIYSSEKGNWSMCNERFNYLFFLHFDITMYWNNALHWLETKNSQFTHYKLNIKCPDHPIITIIQIPQSLQQGRNLFKSYGNILPMIITLQIPYIFHLEGKLFNSRGCLLLVRRDNFRSSEFTIYEIMKGSSIWSVREDGSFLVINLSGKVVEYNLVSNNLRDMYDMGSNQLTNDYHDGFIPPGFILPFAMYDMRPNQVDHKHEPCGTSKELKEVLEGRGQGELKPSKVLEGACVFTDKWSLNELAYGVPTDGPYQTNPPSPDDIISSIRIDREGQVRHICHEEEIDFLEYQVLTREIKPNLKPLEEIIQENVFCLGGNRDHVLACLCYMHYYVAHFEEFNLAYYMAKQMEWVTRLKRLILPYERNPRKDRGTRRGCHSTSSSSAFDQPSSSHLNDDDDDGNGEGTKRASTPSPIRYVNSLTNEVPQVF
uniref:Uncharacterized protein n=1 Tax=Tanacetum cinerariifolium TaxID=118510 RepID=A0A699H2G9_TANCI|nr:hypothetical protein [Tanacetum cinerariifolium]